LNIKATNQGLSDTGLTAAVNNAGTWIKNGAPNGGTGTSVISTLFNNTGTVDVETGTLSLSGGGTDIGAVYKGPGTVNFGGGTRTLDATSNIQGNATFSGGATTVNGGTGTGLFTVTGGTATFGTLPTQTVTTGSLTQSGGELNGSGTLSVTGTGSFSGGTQSGAGTTATTIVQGGASFSLANFGLDGGRTLQLGGSSTANTVSGNTTQIDLNAINPNTQLSDSGAGTLTVLSGATFTDKTTTATLNIKATNQGLSDTGLTAAVNNAGTWIKNGGTGTSVISTLFNNTGTVDVETGTLSLSGSVNNSGTLEADGGNLTVSGNSVAGNGLITGASILEFAGANIATNVSFQTDSSGTLSGTLRLDQSQSYSGTVTGFSLVSNTTKFDLSDINFGAGTTTATYSAIDSTHGTLTVKDASAHKAVIAMQGADYTGAVWVTASDGRGGTTVRDPSLISSGDVYGNATIGDGGQLEIGPNTTQNIVFAGSTGTLTLDQSQSFNGQISGFGGQDKIDLSDIGFGANTTLGYSANGDNSGGTLMVSDGVHTANVALLGQYAGSSFVMAGDGHGGTLITDPSLLGTLAQTSPTTNQSGQVAYAPTDPPILGTGAQTSPTTNQAGQVAYAPTDPPIRGADSLASPTYDGPTTPFLGPPVPASILGTLAQTSPTTNQSGQVAYAPTDPPILGTGAQTSWTTNQAGQVTPARTGPPILDTGAQTSPTTQPGSLGWLDSHFRSLVSDYSGQGLGNGFSGLLNEIDGTARPSAGSTSGGTNQLGGQTISGTDAGWHSYLVHAMASFGVAAGGPSEAGPQGAMPLPASETIVANNTTHHA
jgi:hypothetical protein